MEGKDIISKIKESLKEGRVIYGYNKVLKSLLRGEVEMVIVAKNCPEHIKSDLKHYCNLSKIPFEEVQLSNMELGALIGRAHSVATLAILQKKNG